MALHEIEPRISYLNILAEDGTFRMAVEETDPRAVRRDWVSKDGKTSGTKFERKFASLDGMITSIYFHDGNYGKNINVIIEDGDERFCISLSTANSKFAEDLMRKIPNIDVTKRVSLTPMSYTSKKTGKLVQVIKIKQEGKAVENAFYDFKEKKNLLGLPDYQYKVDKKTGERKEVSSAEWKIYFAICTQYMIDYITEHHLLDSRPNIAEENWKITRTLDEQYPTEELGEVAF